MRNSLYFTYCYLLLSLCFVGSACKNNGTENSKIVTYQSATVYAASTDYYFKDKYGQTVQFRANNLPAEKKIDMPDNLLESDVREGSPTANPKLIGKQFKLIYDVNNQLIRVAQIK